MSPSERVVLRRLARELDRISPAALRAAHTFIREDELRNAMISTAERLDMPMARIQMLVGDLTEYGANGENIITVLKCQLTTPSRLAS